VRVLTWNLWWRFGPWEERQEPIRRELERVAADVISLQEVWGHDGHDQARWLADALGMQLIRSVDGDGRPQSFGNAILSRDPIRLLDQVALPGPDGRTGPRTALIAVIETEPGPRLYVNTHLEWQYWASAVRQAQLQLVVDTVDGHRRHTEAEDPIPIVFTGDLNGQPETQELRRLTGLEPGYHPSMVFIDCWAAVGEGPGFTWTRDNPNAAEASWPRRRLDYVLVSWPREKPFCSPLHAELVGTRPDPVVPSDHYGVLVELDDRTGTG
jgi:endonuclease/exonuclease/phosphatase family metal-dependent hydrolase